MALPADERNNAARAAPAASARRMSCRDKAKWNEAKTADPGPWLRRAGPTPEKTPTMDLNFTDDELAFRAEIRAWVAENLPGRSATRCTTRSG